jgi:uncharacterized protein (DUF302 family)
MNRLEAEVKARGVTVFARIDHESALHADESEGGQAE